MSHSNVLRILYLEDNIDDAGLIHFEMKKLSVPFDLRIADCKEQYERLINEIKPNIVLSDYNVPGYNIFDAINKARAFDPLIPFIVISGVIGESKAVEAMLSGANDCIMKDKLVRLIPAIERELRDTEIKRNQAIQQDELILYKDIFRDLINPAAIFNEFGVLISSNTAFSKMHHLNLDKKITFSQIYDKQKNGGLFDKIFDKGKYTKEFLIKTKRGNRSIHFTSFKHCNKNKAFIVCIETDISERRKIELHLTQEKRHFESLLETPSGYAIYRVKVGPTPLKAVVTHVSKSIIDIVGIAEEDMFNFSKWFQNIHPGDINRVIESNAKGCYPPFKFHETFRYNHPKNGLIWLNVRANGTPSQDDPGYIEWANGILTDVTEMKNAQLEKEELNRKINALISNLPGIVYKCILDKKWTMLFLNNTILPITGYEKDELIDNKKIAFADIIHPADKDRVYNTIKTASENNNQFSIYYRIISKKGITKWVWEKGSFLKENPGGKIYIEGYIDDITAERQSMIKLEHKNEQFRIYLESSPIAIFITNKKGQYRYVNKAAQVLLQLDKEELLSKSIPDIVATHDKEKALKSFTKLMATGKLENIEINLISNKGNEVPVTLDAIEISDNEYIAYCKRK